MRLERDLLRVSCISLPPSLKTPPMRRLKSGCQRDRVIEETAARRPDRARNTRRRTPTPPHTSARRHPLAQVDTESLTDPLRCRKPNRVCSITGCIASSTVFACAAAPLLSFARRPGWVSLTRKSTPFPDSHTKAERNRET